MCVCVCSREDCKHKLCTEQMMQPWANICKALSSNSWAEMAGWLGSGIVASHASNRHLALSSMAESTAPAAFPHLPYPPEARSVLLLCWHAAGNLLQVLIADIWKEHTPAPFSSLPDTYSFMVKHGMLWRMAYHSIQPRFIHTPYFNIMHAFVSRHLAEAFDVYDPDLVVSVHPLMQHIPCRVLEARAKRLGRARRTPFATVVTDFTTCHNTWFFKGVDKCFVPTEFCKQLGRRMGLSEEQLVLYGLPIRPIFSKKLPSKDTLRKKLVSVVVRQGPGPHSCDSGCFQSVLGRQAIVLAVLCVVYQHQLCAACLLLLMLCYACQAGCVSQPCRRHTPYLSAADACGVVLCAAAVHAGTPA